MLLSKLVNMVIMFMGFIWNFTVFSRYREAFPFKLVMAYRNLVNFTSMNKIKLFFFSPLLVPLETWDSRVELSGEWERLSPGMYRNLDILWTKNSTEAESDGRPLVWNSWPRETIWEFILLLLRSSTKTSLEEPV